MNKKYSMLILPGIILLSLFLNFPSLKYYFFQDDWFVLNWVQHTSPLSLLAFRTDIIYWRPLSMPIFFALNKFFFNLHPFYFHIVAFCIFFILIVSVYSLFKILFKNEKLALLASFLYATWHIHFISLSWLSTTSYIIGPLFQVISFIFFIKFSINHKSKTIIYSFILFLLALSSSEMSIVLPTIFLIWGKILKGKNYFIYLIPFFFVSLFYLFVRFVIFPIPAKDDYQIQAGFGLVYNFIWYVLWGLGLPESFKQLIFIKLPAQSFKILSQFWQISIPFLILVLFLIKKFLEDHLDNKKQFLFGLFWLFLGLTPVLVLVNHSYPMYLSFAGIGLIYILVTLFRKANLISLGFFVLTWTLTSVSTLHFTRLTHWVTNIQAISRSYVDYSKKKVINPPANSVFILESANKEFSEKNRFILIEGQNNLELALNDQSAIHVIYNNDSLKSYYSAIPKSLNLPPEINIFELAPRNTDD